MNITTRREASQSYWGPGSIFPLQSGILVCMSHPVVWQWGDEVVNDHLRNLLGYAKNPLKLATEVKCSVFPNQWYCPSCKSLIENKNFAGAQSLLRSPTCTNPSGDCTNLPRPRLIPLRVVLACSTGHVSQLPIRDQLRKKLGLQELNGAVKILPSRTGSWAMSSVWLVGYESQKFSLSELMQDIQCPGQTPWLGKQNGEFRKSICDLRLENNPTPNQNPDHPTPQLKMLVVGDSALYTPLRVSVIKRGKTLKERFIECLIVGKYLDVFQYLTDSDNQVAYLKGKLADFQKITQGEHFELMIDSAFVDQCLSASQEGATSGTTMAEIKRVETEYFHDAARNRDETQPVVVSLLQNHGLEDWITTVLRVEKVTLTSAFVGFSRVGRRFDNDYPTEARRFYGADYIEPIPVSESIGEGIYIELNQDKLQKWMQTHGTQWTTRFPMGLDQKKPDPRYVLVHTISHALMTRFAMLCGYPLVSLHERIYADFNDYGRVGVLIYTTGDAMGSLGGLAGILNSADSFRELFIDAIRETAWCSSDPVCMEAHYGACYACLHLPEMACENFNRALDRGTIWGLPDNPERGFFNGLGL